MDGDGRCNLEPIDGCVHLENTKSPQTPKYLAPQNNQHIVYHGTSQGLLLVRFLVLFRVSG